MFRVNRESKSLSRLRRPTFSELGVRERDDLQEWLIDSPDVFGEELLIIQKEFDGFAGTRERLDLLALDKDGHLVLIENKRDDSGRDLVGQALKYAAYCSTLDPNQIVDIFGSYLERHCETPRQEATSIVSEFLEREDWTEAVVNEGNTQRIIMVAANFRKEVTSTALWLLEYGLAIQCFKVTPYSLGDELILDVRQVIPTPEARDYMIVKANKEKQEARVKSRLGRLKDLRLRFWSAVLDARRTGGTDFFANTSPNHSNFLSCGTGVSGAIYRLVFTLHEVRVELNFNTFNRQNNKFMFDRLIEFRDEIEERFEDRLQWWRFDDNKLSKIAVTLETDGSDEGNWPVMTDWLVEHLVRLDEAVKDHLNAAAQALKEQFNP